MPSEALYADGSRSEWTGGGGSFHEGGLAIYRLQIISLKGMIRLNLKHGMQPSSKVSITQAIENVLTPITGKRYPRSRKGKEQAMADCEGLLALIESDAVVYEEES